MQNVVNSMTPFFDPTDGKPLSAGHVTFVQLGTDNVTTLIDIRDIDNVPLPNPLALDDAGRFTTQPFAPDGMDFKMIVEKLVSTEPVQFQQVGIVYQKHGSAFTVDLHGAPVVDNLSELRLLSPDFGKAVVLGYGEAGDYCPPRIFQWKEADIAENYGTHVRSSVEGYENAGCWICEPEDSVDVRWFGIDPASDHVDCLERLGYVIASYPNKSVYFPYGSYYLSDDVTVNSVIMDGARFRTTGAKDVVFTIDKLERKGGYFYADDTADSGSIRVIPKINGVFYTSMCAGTINEFMTSGAMADVNVVVFDNADLREGSAAREFEKKLVIVEGHNIPSSVAFKDSVVLDLKNKRTMVQDLFVGEKLSIVNGTYTDLDRSPDPIPEAKVYFGSTEILSVDFYDRFKVLKELVEYSEILELFMHRVHYSVSGNPYYVKSTDGTDVDLTDMTDYDSFGRASQGDVVIVEGWSTLSPLADCKVIYNRDLYYRPDKFYAYVELPVSHALAFICVRSYNGQAQGGPVSAKWLPLDANVTTHNVTEE